MIIWVAWLHHKKSFLFYSISNIFAFIPAHPNTCSFFSIDYASRCTSHAIQLEGFTPPILGISVVHWTYQDTLSYFNEGYASRNLIRAYLTKPLCCCKPDWYIVHITVSRIIQSSCLFSHWSSWNLQRVTISMPSGHRCNPYVAEYLALETATLHFIIMPSYICHRLLV